MLYKPLKVQSLSTKFSSSYHSSPTNKSAMALSKQLPFLLAKMFIFIMLLVPHTKSLNFFFPRFNPNIHAISYQGDAFSTSESVQLTRNQVNDNLTYSVGRASYYRPVRIWNAKTGMLTDFITQFSFSIKSNRSFLHGDGLSFFMASADCQIPSNATGGLLGLFSPETAMGSSSNQIVAVEFDSFSNSWDPQGDHVGININSIASAVYAPWTSNIQIGAEANAWVIYNSTSMNLDVYLTYDQQRPIIGGPSILSYYVDLRKVLPEWVKVGFSAATGQLVETHSINSWQFGSSLSSY